MKSFLLLPLLAWDLCYAETKTIESGNAKITIEDPAPEVTTKTEVKTKETVAATYAYTCTKGNKKVIYRLSYKDVDGRPPCRVYKLENGKRTVIGESLRTSEVCEKVLDKILHKVADVEGMECDETN